MTKKRGKNFRESQNKYEKSKQYSVPEAIKTVKELGWAKFRESVDVALHLGINTKRSEEQVRGAVNLPHGTGKESKIVVFAQAEKAQEAKDAGADFVGAEDIAEKIQKGWTDFDAAIATPDMMKIVGKLGRILGPRGLMPNPKVGTVTNDINEAVSSVKKGKVEYRADRFGIVHATIGKIDFTEKQINENFRALMDAILKAKPASTKGRYILSSSISSTMGPGIKMDPSKVMGWMENR